MQGAGAAGVAFIGVEYLLPLVLAPERSGAGAVLAGASALMLALLALNYAGIRIGARTQNALSLLKIAMILGLAVGASTVAVSVPAAAPSARPSWTGLIAASVAVFYAYGGYQCTMNLGGDVRDARRNLPLAVTAGMGIVVCLYLGINFAYHRVLGVEGVAGSSLVAASLARQAFGPAGESAVSVAIFLSAAGFVNATILQMPRSYYAMAENGALPRAFLRVNPRTQVQEAGLLFLGATMLLPALLLGSFEKLLNYVMFTDAVTLVVVASTVFVLRARRVGEAETFRIPGYPVPPAVFITCLLGVAAYVAATQARLALAGSAILLAGWPLFYLARRVSAVRKDQAPARATFQ
jgi:APA family basic amino acid/polyamine antiporter